MNTEVTDTYLSNDMNKTCDKIHNEKETETARRVAKCYACI